MKNILCIIFYTFILSQNAYSVSDNENYLISGHYKNQNLFLKNSIDKDGIGYAIKSIRLNGELITCSINIDVIEIDFSKYGLKKGDKIEILIHYDGITKPEIIYLQQHYSLNNEINENWIVKNLKKDKIINYN